MAGMKRYGIDRCQESKGVMKMVDVKKQPFYLSSEQAAWVEDRLNSLSTEQKVGQLFCVMGGDYAQDQLKAMVSDGRVGGILFRPAPAEEIRAWYQELDAAAPVPLLKAANLEEGGAGAISDGTLFGWPMLAAAADDAGAPGRQAYRGTPGRSRYPNPCHESKSMCKTAIYRSHKGNIRRLE